MLISVLVLAATSLADPCHAQIPAGLRPLLLTQYREHRLPSAADTSPDVLARAFKKPNPNPKCILVARDDFNGDGREDVATLMPLRVGSREAVLVVAIRVGSSWRFTTLLDQPFPMEAAYVDRAPPGRTYRQSRAFDGEAIQLPAVKSLRPRHVGIAFGVQEAWEICFFLERGEWLRVYTST